MDNLHTAAFEYGIILKDLAVIDRLFKGKVFFEIFFFFKKKKDL
jgi:hypothetical protein